MFKSKRFVAFSIAVVLFVLMIYTTSFPVLEIAGSLTILTSIYIVSDTIRKSGNQIDKDQ
jgi:hypothetical protein